MVKNSNGRDKIQKKWDLVGDRSINLLEVMWLLWDVFTIICRLCRKLEIGMLWRRCLRLLIVLVKLKQVFWR